MTDNPHCMWDKALDTDLEPMQMRQGALVFSIESYGDPMREVGSAWTRFGDRMRSITEMLQDAGIDIYADAPGDEPVDEPVDEPEKRDDLWGFAPGDRVRYAEDNAAKGLIGKVVWTGGCSMAKILERCRDICPNVQVMFTHRQASDGTVSPTTVGPMTVPPGHLEHID